jgi:hypothetical protein
MSPRTKENHVNKLKIEYMIQKADGAFDKKNISHKIIERTEEDEMKVGKVSMGKSFYSSRIDKIGILKPAQKMISYAQPKL